MYRFNSGGCCCCCYCDNSDILLLVDTTRSMRTEIKVVASTFEMIRKTYQSQNCRWSLAEYRSISDGGVFLTGWNILKIFTNDFDEFVDQVQLLTAPGGDSGQVLMALKNAGELWVSDLLGSTDPNRKRVIVWVGDFPGNNGKETAVPGIFYPTRQAAIDSLVAANIRVIAINDLAEGFGIDDVRSVEIDADKPPGQATDIVQQTGGTVFHNGIGNEKAVKDALCRAFSDRPTRTQGITL